MTIQITTELIKQLRDATGVSVMQCKKALEEAEGNMDKAILILKKKSSDIALKKLIARRRPDLSSSRMLPANLSPSFLPAKLISLQRTATLSISQTSSPIWYLQAARTQQ